MRVSQMINHEKRWARLKADPEKYKEYLSYIRQKQKTKNKKYSEGITQYKRELREIAREIGNCPQCYGLKDENETHILCAKCRKYSREYYKKQREKNAKLK